MSSGHWNGKYYAVEHGANSRLDEVHAAILLKNLNISMNGLKEEELLQLNMKKNLKILLRNSKRAP